jgi:hypothetical protein
MSIPFDIGGEHHTLIIQESPDDAQLLVTSTPMTIAQLLKDRGAQGSDLGKEIQRLADKAQKDARATKRFAKAHPTEVTTFEAKDEEVEADEHALTAALSALPGVAVDEGPDGTASYSTGTFGFAGQMTSTLTPFFVARHPGSEATAIPPGWPGGTFRGTHFGRGHLLAGSLGGDGGRRTNLVPMEQFKMNDGQFAENENRLRGGIKNGQTIDYNVKPEYGEFPVPTATLANVSPPNSLPGQEALADRLEKDQSGPEFNEMVKLPDPIPIGFDISATTDGLSRLPLGPFTTAHLTIKAPASPFTSLAHSGFVRHTLGPNEVLIRQSRAIIFKLTGR